MNRTFPQFYAAVALLCCRLALPAAADPNPWGGVIAPTSGQAQAIGGYAHGCLAGAARLPTDGPGFGVIHLSRRRYFGHPDTVAFVERLGRRAHAARLPIFYVGDMAQPRGGPLSYGHASHQTGLDVDIWFTFDRGALPAPASREAIALPSMLRPNWQAVDPERFGADQIALLRLAATDPKVERIFVNPVIKETLCRQLRPGERSWLERLRPWWGHDDHFHVRLRCPADSPECEAQAPVPDGDGCDDVLESWVRQQHGPPRFAPPKRKLPVLPTECRVVLER